MLPSSSLSAPSPPRAPPPPPPPPLLCPFAALQPVPPMEFILSLRKQYPQFAQTSRCAAFRASSTMGLCVRLFSAVCAD